MAIYEYKIATEAQGVEGLTNLEDLGLPPPSADLPHLSVTHYTGEGLQKGDGAEVVVWHWTIFLQAHYNILRGYCPVPNLSAWVYIRTRKDDGTWANYKAAMQWPKNPSENRRMGQAFMPFEVEFTRLEEQ